MAKRINVILPESTVHTIDRLARPGQRSHFIDVAVQHYVMTASPEALRERLRLAALRDRDRDLSITSDYSTGKKSGTPELAEKRGNLPYGARPGKRSRNPEDPACPDYSERH